MNKNRQGDGQWPNTPYAKRKSVEDAAARWKGNSQMWTAWNNQLLWIDFKVRWIFRLKHFRLWWRNLQSDIQNERSKYVHPAG